MFTGENGAYYAAAVGVVIGLLAVFARWYLSASSDPEGSKVSLMDWIYWSSVCGMLGLGVAQFSQEATGEEMLSEAISLGTPKF